jgi:hypothetical protein
MRASRRIGRRLRARWAARRSSTPPGFASLLVSDLREIYVHEYGLKIPYPQFEEPDEEQMGRFGRKEEQVLVGPLVCVKETEKALLVKFEGVETWVPKSQVIGSESEVNEQGDQGMLVVTEWIAKEKGWM